MTSLQRLIPYLKNDRLSFGLAFLAILCVALTTAFYAFLSGPALQYLFTGDFQQVLYRNSGELRSFWQWLPPQWLQALTSLRPHHTPWVLPVLIVITAIGKGLSQAAQFFLLGRIAQRVLRQVRSTFFASLLQQNNAFLTKQSQGDLLSRLTSDTQVIEQGVFYGIGPIVREPFVLIALIAYLFYADPSLALILFITIPTAAIALVQLSRWIKRVSDHGQLAQGEIHERACEALNGLDVIQACYAHARESQRFWRTLTTYYHHMLRSYTIRAIRTPIMETLGALALGGLLLFIGSLSQAENIDSAHYMSFLAAFFFMYDPLKRLGHVGDYLAAAEAACQRVFAIVDIPPPIVDAPKAPPLRLSRGSISCRNLSFNYGQGPVLRHIDLSIEAGETLALVGPSGAGKSTLVELLMRFLEPTAGCIEIDGQDIRTVTQASLRQHVAYVGQNTFLFNASVYDNIAFAKPEASSEQVHRAACLAHADDFIRALPEGYDTNLGHAGSMLSGGQRQRLAIARALLADAPILIMDEATSALDLESEEAICKSMQDLFAQRTTLIVAHRPSTIQQAKRIAVLQEGRLVQVGSHPTLLTSPGPYAEIIHRPASTALESPNQCAL